MNLHTPAPDAGRNAHCSCGAEYSLVSSLMRHVAERNEAAFALMADRPEFEGFGYIGGRRHLSDHQRAEADRMLALHIAYRGLDAERLFAWANSKDGRFYADAWADGNRYGHAEKSLP